MHAYSCTKTWYLFTYLAWYHKEKEKKKGKTIPVTAVPLNRISLVTPRVKKSKEKGKGNRFASSPSNPSTYAHMHAYADEYGVHKT